MSADDPGEITLLLAKARRGDKLAENRLANMLMPELERMASRILSREYRGATMETLTARNCSPSSRTRTANAGCCGRRAVITTVRRAPMI